MPEFDEPIDDYVSFFKDAHERNVSDYFEGLVQSADIDEQLNIETVSQLRTLEQSVSQSSKSRGWWKAGRIAAIVAVIGLGSAAVGLQGLYLLCLIPAIAIVVLIFLKLNPEISQLNDTVTQLESSRDAKANEAWVQMEPLNRLFTWDMATRLFMKTFPFITFDSYFTADRLADLSHNYDLSPEFNDGRSIHISQSGEFKGNPFVIARYKQHWIGSRTYTGSLVIYWTESVRDGNGNWVNVQRTQTLTASVVKPFPEYQVRTTIIYGHEIAPSLSFSRTPSTLSGLDEGLMNN